MEIRSLPNLSSRATQALMEKNYNHYINDNRGHKKNLEQGITMDTKGVWQIVGADQNDSGFSGPRTPTLCYVKSSYNAAIIFACSLELWNYWSNEGPGGAINKIQILDIEE